MCEGRLKSFKAAVVASRSALADPLAPLVTLWPNGQAWYGRATGRATSIETFCMHFAARPMDTYIALPSTP